jgi:hypothetical protein
VSGVYAIVIGKKVKYIGECSNLSVRYNTGYGIISPRKCFKGGQETNCRINKLICRAAKTNHKISLWFLKTKNYKAIEKQLRTYIEPEWNKI